MQLRIMADANFNHLCLAIQPLAQEFLNRCNKLFATKLIVTWRNADDQDIAHAKGLSNAGAGHSPHNCCITDGTPAARAFDFAIFMNGAYITDGGDPRYTEAGQIAESLGLTWGGRWDHPDYDHCELSDWKNDTL